MGGCSSRVRTEGWWSGSSSGGSSTRLTPVLLACSPCGEHRTNIGLNLKFNKKNEEVPGYTKRTEKEWLYSAAVEEVLAEYLDRWRPSHHAPLCPPVLHLSLFDGRVLLLQVL